MSTLSIPIKIEDNEVENDKVKLLNQKKKLENRLIEINGPTLNLKNDWKIVKTETHWDSLLQELIWLSNDFSKERQRHLGNGKKLSRAVEVYHSTKQIRIEKKEKEDHLQMRKTASRISREVSKFWLKINKIVAFKQKMESDEARQKAMDKHLVHLVKQTERYTKLLVSNMEMGGTIGQQINRSQSQQSKRNRIEFRNPITDFDDAKIPQEAQEQEQEQEEKQKEDKESDSDSDSEDYVHEEELDDETTLVEEEAAAAQDNINYEDEISRLQGDSEIPIEELRAMYSGMRSDEDEDDDEDEDEDDSDDNEEEADEDNEQKKPTTSKSKAKRSQKRNNEESQEQEQKQESDSDSEDYVHEEELDDETTLVEEEAAAAQDNINYEDEISRLQGDSEIPIEELRAMYSGMRSDDDEDDENDDNDDNEEDEEQEKPTSPKSKAKRSQKRNNEEESQAQEQKQESDSDSEDYVHEEELDDETTLVEEEAVAAQDNINYEDEISRLQGDSEIPIEELRAMYSGMRSDEDEDEDDSDDNEEENDEDNEQNQTTTTSKSKAKQSQKRNNKEEDDDEEEEDRELNSQLQKRPHSAVESIDNGGDDDDDTFDGSLKRLEAAELIARSINVDIPFILSRELSLREYQHIGLNWLVSLHERRLNGILADEMGLGKAQPYDSRVLTPNGWTQIGLLCVGDEVIGANGTSTKVTGVYPRGKRTTFQVEFDDGYDVEVSDDHLWRVKDEQNNKYWTLSTKTLISHLEANKEDALMRWSIPIVKPVIFNCDVSPPLDLYFLGIFLSCGSYVNDKIKLTIPSQNLNEITSKCAILKNHFEDTFVDLKGDELSTFKNCLGNFLTTQTLPTWIMRSSLHHRIQFIQGIFDVLGEISSDSILCTGYSWDNEVVSSIIEVIQSLGAVASHHPDLKQIQAVFPSDISPFSIQELKNKFLSLKMQPIRRIKTITPCRLTDVLCISVAANDHLYVTDHFIVTHNTIQTISLLAYLATYRGLWGPHLIVVPTSCLINWEIEFKKWCPAFKVLTYYGSQKTRKALRSGWSKLNSFHVCITSYQVVVQDSSSFRRKRWYYMILDEAHNIKNLMELWSLMHFLMPHIFRSRKEFSYWFNNPLNSMVEGNRGINNDIISRLHGIMRPFLLRRLKKDVAKQLPPKFEHVVMCKLSKRQALLYEEFMSRTSTRALMSGGNYMGMMNILMQLRKVCNHPDLFEPRLIVSPFQMDDITFRVSPLILSAYSDSQKGSYRNSEMLQKWSYGLDSISRSEIGRLAYQDVSLVNIDDVNLPDLPPSLRQFKYQEYIHHFKLTIMNIINLRRKHNSLLSIQRCEMIFSSISLSWRLVQSCQLPPNVVNLAILSRSNSRLNQWTPHCWKDLIRTPQDWAVILHDMIIRYVFVLPKVISYGPQLIASRYQSNTIFSKIQMILKPLHSKEKKNIQKYFHSFHSSFIRQRIFFPDRKLVQYDSGKLQTLCHLLRQLKKDEHKCLIFTQMSKMLDILEIFLNLNGHTYVRLDGSTGIEKRQKLMDRFNNDKKIFCFILSTRSGGLGINLTGADTVIFYDSDWNPAMDAQAQDRAHRIGQTREVHIYRLICKSTIEENILIKAKQKRHLDYLVMSEGEFNVGSLFTTNSLLELLGEEDKGDKGDKGGWEEGKEGREKDKEDQKEELKQTKMMIRRENEIKSDVFDVEAAMAAVEDEDDVSALKGAKAEAAQEQQEFDENIIIPNEDGNESSDLTLLTQKSSTTRGEDDLEAEFTRWQESVGGKDFRTLEAALKPVERYALLIRTIVDPFYSLHYLSDQQRMAELQAEEQGQEWDIATIEQEKEEEEYRALADGELLAVNLTKEELQQIKVSYFNEKSRQRKERKLRQLTGEGWRHLIDEATGIPFWYNEDTGEASYGQPDVIKKQQIYKTAMLRRWNAFPSHLILIVLSYLDPYPDRIRCSYLSDRWRRAVSDPIFYKRVLSIESGVHEMQQLEVNTYHTLSEALTAALPGETISLDSGHHLEWNILLTIPVRIIGSEEDPSKVIVEVTGEMEITEMAGKTTLIGITFCRVRRSVVSKPLFTIRYSTVNLICCTFKNDGSGGGSCLFSLNSDLNLLNCVLQHGKRTGITLFHSLLCAFHTKFSRNEGVAISCHESGVLLEDCRIQHNTSGAIRSTLTSRCLFSHCEVKDNTNTPFLLDEDTLFETHNCIGDEVSQQFFLEHSIETKNPPEEERSEKVPDEEIDSFSLLEIPKKTPSSPKKRSQASFLSPDFHSNLNSNSNVQSLSSSDEDEEEDDEGGGRGEGNGNHDHDHGNDSGDEEITIMPIKKRRRKMNEISSK